MENPGPQPDNEAVPVTLRPPLGGVVAARILKGHAVDGWPEAGCRTARHIFVVVALERERLFGDLGSRLARVPAAVTAPFAPFVFAGATATAAAAVAVAVAVTAKSRCRLARQRGPGNVAGRTTAVLAQLGRSLSFVGLCFLVVTSLTLTQHFAVVLFGLGPLALLELAARLANLVRTHPRIDL